MSLALEKIKQIKKMRIAGHTFAEIGESVGVSSSYAYRNSKDYSPQQKRHTSSTCQFPDKKGLTCQRHSGHGGVHLSDETDKLIYWE